MYFCTALADMAQLVEQRIRNAWVAGSSPARGSRTRLVPQARGGNAGLAHR